MIFETQEAVLVLLVTVIFHLQYSEPEQPWQGQDKIKPSAAQSPNSRKSAWNAKKYQLPLPGTKLDPTRRPHPPVQSTTHQLNVHSFRETLAVKIAMHTLYCLYTTQFYNHFDQSDAYSGFDFNPLRICMVLVLMYLQLIFTTYAKEWVQFNVNTIGIPNVCTAP